MPTRVAIPRFGAKMGSVVLAEWYERDGASVSAGAAVLRVESDNVAFDVEAEADGVLRHRARAGESLVAGDTVALLLSIGERLPVDPSFPAEEAPDEATSLDVPLAELTQPEAPESAGKTAASPPRLLRALDPRSKRSRGTAVLPPREPVFDSAAGPDFPPGSLVSFDPPEAAPEHHEVPTAEEPTPPSPAQEAPPTADVGKRRPETLKLRVQVNFSEVRKLCEQLAREWRAEGLKPADEDVVVRAFARAMDGAGLLGPEKRVTLRRVTAFGEIRVPLANAGLRPFHEAVAERSRPAATVGWAGPEIVSFSQIGIHDGDVRLAEGVRAALAFGAPVSLSVREGARSTMAPHVTITLAVDAEVLGENAAGMLLARIRELLEAPYALLAA